MIPNKAIVEALEAMLRERPMETSGICFNLRIILLQMYDANYPGITAEDANSMNNTRGVFWAKVCYIHMFQHWPDVTEDTLYPIAGGKLAYNMRELWDDGDYGLARKSLCAFCIEYLNEDPDGGMEL